MKLSKEPQVEINDGHYLEIMDRLHVQMCMAEDHLFKHPVTEQNKAVREPIIKAIVNLIQAYQEVGKLAVKKSKAKKNASKRKKVGK